MKQQPKMERLKKVQKVEAPPFLLTRINAKIAAQQIEQLPRSWTWAGTLALGLMLLFNFGAIRTNQQTNGRQDTIEVLANGLQLSSANQLYHE